MFSRNRALTGLQFNKIRNNPAVARLNFSLKKDVVAGVNQNQQPQQMVRLRDGRIARIVTLQNGQRMIISVQ